MIWLYSVFISKTFDLSFPTSYLLTYFSDFFIFQLHFWSSRGQVLVLGYHISCPLYLLVWTMFCVLSTHVDLFGHLPQSTYINWPNHHSTLLRWSCHYSKSWVGMIWCIRPEPTRSRVHTIYCSLFKYCVNIHTHTHTQQNYKDMCRYRWHWADQLSYHRQHSRTAWHWLSKPWNCYLIMRLRRGQQHVGLTWLLW